MNTQDSLLFFGSSGMLGVTAYQCLQASYQHSFCSGRENRYQQEAFYSVDVSDLNAVRELIRRLKPQVVVYASGIINKALCERDPRYTRQVHCETPALITQLLGEWGGKMVYISSDAVYGSAQKLHAESDSLNPLTLYAETKAEGEAACLESSPRTLCCRVTPVGLTPDLTRGTLAEWSYQTLAHQDVTGFSNYYFTPISSRQLGQALGRSLEKDLVGVYNMGSDEVVSKYQFIQLMKERFPQQMTYEVKSGLLPHVDSYCAQMDSQKYCQDTGQAPLNIASVIQTLSL